MLDGDQMSNHLQRLGVLLVGIGPCVRSDSDLPPDFLGYEVAACPSLSLCAHLLDFLRLHCLHSI